MEEISIDYGELILKKLQELNKLIKDLKNEKELPNSPEY